MATPRKDPSEYLPDGRPPIFTDPEEMQRRITHYFNSIRMVKNAYIKAEDSPDYSYEEVRLMTPDQKKCKVPARDANGEIILTWEWITAPHEGDLHRAIGIESRDCWLDYGRNPLFSDTVKKAKAIVEDYYSKTVTEAGSNTNGLKFVLGCCYGWKDIQYVKTEEVGKLEDDLV